MRTKKLSVEPSSHNSFMRFLTSLRKRSQTLQPNGRQALHKGAASTGPQSRSNRITRAAARLWRGQRIRDLEVALHDRDTTIKEYRRQNIGLLDTTQQLEERYEIFAIEKAEAEETLRKMRNKAGSLQSHLEECKDDLFRLQPLNEVSDSTILSQYEQLNQHVASWVDEFFSRIDSENAHCEASGRPPQPLLRVEGTGFQEFFASSPNASEYWLRHWLHLRLQQNVFIEDVYLSYLRDDYVDFIRVTERSMGALEPRRDSTTLEAWRSETLAAIANHPDMKGVRSKQAFDLAEQLYQDIIVYATPEACGQHESFCSLHENILIPAMELALNIQLMLGRCYFHPRTFSVPSGEHRLTFQHVSEHTMIDISTRRTLKEDSPVIAADDGTIGEKLFVLEPGLVRRGRGENPDVLMRKAVYLVRLDRPLGKRHKGSMSLQKDVIMLE